MEKTINVNGREVKLKSTGAIPLMYKVNFKRDFFADITKLSKMGDDLEKIDMEVFYNLLWLYAKKADNSIGTIEEFFDSFDELPILDFVGELTELAMGSMTTTNTKN